MAAAIWSCAPGAVLAPAGGIVLPVLRQPTGCCGLKDRPDWRTVDRRRPRLCSDRIAADFSAARSALATSGRRRMRRDPARRRTLHLADGGQTTTARSGGRGQCMATRPWRCWPTPIQPSVRIAAGAFRTVANRAVLHGDTALMPKRRGVWSSWNYLAPQPGCDCRAALRDLLDEPAAEACPGRPVFVTLNPCRREPAPDLRARGAGSSSIRCSMPRRMVAQRDIWTLQGARAGPVVLRRLSRGRDFMRTASRPGWKWPNGWAACAGPGTVEADESGRLCSAGRPCP